MESERLDELERLAELQEPLSYAQVWITELITTLRSTQAELAETRNDFTALQRAIVGDSGLSAIIEARRMKTELAETKAKLVELVEALDERCLFINPHILEASADEIDCDGMCENIWREGDTNASGCYASERGEYCPNDVAETLRAVAKVSRAMGNKEPAVLASLKAEGDAP